MIGGVMEDWVRGIRPSSLGPIEGPVAPKESAFSRYVLGAQAEKLLAGIASPEDIGWVMKAVIEKAEGDARKAMKVLLVEPSLETEVAQAAHFDGRVASGILTYVNNLIRDGRAAAKAIEEEAEDNPRRGAA